MEPASALIEDFDNYSFDENRFVEIHYETMTRNVESILDYRLCWLQW